MNISKIASKHTLNATNIGSVNATIKAANVLNSSAKIYTNKTAVKKTSISSEDAQVINNVTPTILSDIRQFGMLKNNSLTHIQKQPLYLKYHGMPGVGVIGITGDQGEHGNSIYFGNIDDFFDGVTINIGNLIYALSERKNLGAASDSIYFSLVILPQMTNTTLSRIVSSIAEDTNNTYLYTGTYANAFSDILYDADNQYKLMYNMLASLSQDTNILNIYDLKIKNTPISSNADDVSKYNIDSTGEMTDSTQTIVSDIDHITYEDSDAIAEILINSNKVKEVADAYPTTIIDNSTYSAFYASDGAYNYIKETQSLNGSTYITGPSQYYAEVSSTEHSINTVDGTYVTAADVFYYIKQAFEIIYNLDRDSSLFKGVIKASNTGYFGLDYSQLFIINSSANLQLKEKKDILTTSNITLKAFILKYYTILDNYITNLSNSLSPALANTIMYSDNGDAKIFIPVSLNSYYKTGDTLYFYTDDQSADDVNIEYMVCLTDDMAGCSKENLISYAQLTEPFTIKRLNNTGSRIECFNTAAVFKNLAEVDSSKFFNKSCINIIDTYTDSTLILANADSSNDKEFVNLNASTYGDSATSIISIDASSVMHINSDSTLKLDSMYVNIDELTSDFNGELQSYLYDSNIIFNDGAFISPLNNIIAYYPLKDFIHVYAAGSVYCEQYFQNYNIDNDKAVPDGYVYGYDVYDSDFQLIKSQYSTSNRLDVNFPLDIEKDESYYYVQIYVAKENGLKFASRISKVTSKFETITLNNRTFGSPLYRRAINNPSTFAAHKLKANGLTIEVMGENDKFIPNNIGDKIIYSISNITATSTSAELNLYSADSSVQILDVIFNHESVSEEATQITDWASVKMTDTSTYTINISSNLPNGAQTLWEYATTYYSTSTNTYESELFSRLNNGIEAESCNQRSIKVTVAYKDAEDSYIKYLNFDITQPGFTDTRDCPAISLDMHYGITDTQQYNTVDHGVLCNQFITYMDVNIENFRDMWSQYVVDNTSVYMDITLLNIASDINWQAQNLIALDIIDRPTIKFLMSSDETAGSNDLENYVKLEVIPFETSEQLTSLNNNIISNVNVSINTSTYMINGIKTYKDVSTILVVDSNDGHESEYILLNNSVVKNAKSTSYIYKGIQKNFSIDIKNIKFDDFSNNTLKLKFLYEIGNPIISNLYLRFAISSINIYVDNGTEKIKFFATSPNVTTSTYLRSYNTMYDYSYRFLSDKLDVMFNPLSYTVCPEDSETTYSAITGSVEKYGMPNEILKSLRFYNSSVYEPSTLYANAKQSRESYMYDWTPVLLKKRYLQDNVKNIMVQPISFTDIIGADSSIPNIDPYNTFLHNHDSYTDTLSGYYLDTLAGNKYMDVVYNGAMMNPKYRDDAYTFIYNEQEYELDRYSQLANNCPAWVSDECTMEMRSDALIKSMDTWNDEYNYVSASMPETNVLFKGILSLYGNGYAYLPLTYDTGQYSDTGVYSDEQIELNSINAQLEKLKSLTTVSANTKKLRESLASRAVILQAKIAALAADGTDIGTTNADKYKDVMSLEETQEYNNVYIYDTVTYDRIYGSAATIYEPEIYEYFRAFLYHINWVYPKYTNNSEITPYRLVSGFDYLLKISEEAQALYEDKWTKLQGSIDNISEMVPYNLLYSVYPRVAYNDEKNNLNCFMLRRPSICTDSDINSFDKCYVLNKRYFNLSSDVKQLTIPYTVK